MRNFGLFAGLFIFINTSAAAVPQEEAFAVLEQWAAAFTASDVDGVINLYTPDAIFFGTGSTSIVTDPAGIRAYFERALLNDRPRGASIDEYSARVVSDSVVIFSYLDTITGVRDGQQTISKGRVTVVVAKKDSGWKVVQFHRSRLPD